MRRTEDAHDVAETHSALQTHTAKIHSHEGVRRCIQSESGFLFCLPIIFRGIHTASFIPCNQSCTIRTQIIPNNKKNTHTHTPDMRFSPNAIIVWLLRFTTTDIRNHKHCFLPTHTTKQTPTPPTPPLQTQRRPNPPLRRRYPVPKYLRTPLVITHAHADDTRHDLLLLPCATPEQDSRAGGMPYP